MLCATPPTGLDPLHVLCGLRPACGLPGKMYGRVGGCDCVVTPTLPGDPSCFFLPPRRPRSRQFLISIIIRSNRLEQAYRVWTNNAVRVWHDDAVKHQPARAVDGEGAEEVHVQRYPGASKCPATKKGRCYTYIRCWKNLKGKGWQQKRLNLLEVE